jgi:hypothetical protein
MPSIRNAVDQSKYGFGRGKIVTFIMVITFLGRLGEV